MAQSGEQRSWGLGPGKVLTPSQVLPGGPCTAQTLPPNAGAEAGAFPLEACP